MKRFFVAALVAVMVCCFESEAATFQQLVAGGKNSYVEISGDFNLAGATVKIPDNCTIFFKGSKITNGTIDFNGCRILGAPTFLCNVTGDVANDFVDLGWFGLVKNDEKFDNGPIINKVAGNFTRLLLPVGTYYFSTPVVLPDIKYLEFNGDLKYRGNANTTAITVTGVTAVMNFNGLISCNGNKNMSYLADSKNSNIVGIDFVNVNNSTVLVNNVICFNENVRISGIGAGCCYNKFTFGLVRNANVGLRIYSGVKDGKTGWPHENTFIGGRFTNMGGWDYDKQPSYAVKIDGETPDRTANSLLFLKQSFEGYRTIVYANNLKKSVFFKCRVERSNLFVKFVGDCKNNEVSTGYNDDCVLTDDSEATMIACDVNFLQKTLLGEITAKKSTIELDTRVGKVFTVAADSAIKVGIVYLTKDGSSSALSAAENQKLGTPLSNLTTTAINYNSSQKHFENRTKRETVTFSVPDNVTSIKLSINGQFSHAFVYGVGNSPAYTLQ